jgi:Asp-tRNA(Asn)/Glu-tRNA(Gln) amidotransferase A subunit family amidase
VFAVLAGRPAPGPSAPGPSAPSRPGPGGPGDLRIGLVTDQLGHPALQPDVRDVLQDAITALRAAARVTEVDGAVFGTLGELYEEIVLGEAWLVHREQVQRDPGRYGPATLELLKSGSAISPAAYQAASRRRAELRPAAAAVYAQADVLLTPVMAGTAPPAGAPADPGSGRFVRPHNVTGAPAIALPAGWTAAGLPVGLQLCAPPGQDEALLAAAVRIQAILGGPLRERSVSDEG